MCVTGQDSMNTKKFNINEYVWVKLTPAGEEIYLRSLMTHPPKTREVRMRMSLGFANRDVDGYIRFQLWQFMQLFGAHLWNGCDPPFDSSIKIDSKDLTD